MSHTPGPWKVKNIIEEKQRIDIVQYQENGYSIVTVWGGGEMDNYLESNANLISAAPDLLEGCKAALAYLVDPRSKYKVNRDVAADIIRAAVKKAEGK